MNKETVELLNEAISMGIFTALVWFMCEPNVNIWFLYLGWMVGSSLRVLVTRKQSCT